MRSTTEHWPNESPKFSPDQLKLLLQNVSPKVSIKEIIQRSEEFPIKFPVDTVKCRSLLAKGVPQTTLERNANSVYPVLHEAALPLFLQFLIHKKRFGNEVEKAVYKNMTIEQLIDRLLKNRAVSFCGRGDSTLLLNGHWERGGYETIGTSEERPPKILKDYLSYDEIKLSALLSVSSYTYFINDGSRNNSGKYCTDRELLEDFGVIIGLIGPRLEKPGYMEYQEIVISKEQNVPEKGYGPGLVPTLQGCFSSFYEEPCLTYQQFENQSKDPEKYKWLNVDKYFNNDAYEKRLSISIDTLLLEANARGREMGKMAYVHVVGIGLGVWRISGHQNKEFMNAFCKRISFLGDNLTHVSDICFAYIGENSCGKYKDQDVVPIAGHFNEGIRIHFKDKDPHMKLTGNDAGKLLVVSYAWDGNALPGNEFWLGGLSNSGDPAAACSTQVAELHNPHINRNVSAKNLRVATFTGLVAYRDYIEKFNALSESE